MNTKTVSVSAEIKQRFEDHVVIEVSIPLVRSMLNGEEIVQVATNATGHIATAELLQRFDTDGSPIEIADMKFTSKGKIAKEYETPYGKIQIQRHVYQSPEGGDTFCPLDNEARIIGTATPKFAKMIANKYSRSSVDEVRKDLSENHGRHVSRGHIQNISEIVGDIILNKEKIWNYSRDIKDKISTISVGMDGAMILMKQDGYRQAMSGTIAYYDSIGNRVHTDYIAASPEYGKKKFFERMEREISLVKTKYPDAKFIGIADGASDNWTFLKKHTDQQITDFYHASEYLASASQAIFRNNQEKQRIEWLDKHCHDLKHEENAVQTQLKELQDLKKSKPISASNLEKLDAAISYFTNQGARMDYAKYRQDNMPIGSGVTEAACKTTIKQRLCRSGMRWKNKGSSIILALRSMIQSERWDNFWNKVNQYGVPALA